MDVADALRRRRMTRAFDGTELDEDRLVALCETALFAPTAGHARGVCAVTLAGGDGVRRYLDAATDASWRASSQRAPGFELAGGVVVVVCEPGRYAARYAEDDKSDERLTEPSGWPVPYWHADAGALTLALLLLAEADGLAACFLGAFRHEAQVLDMVNAPEGSLLFGAVLFGHAAVGQAASGSLDRPGPSRAERAVRGAFPTD